MTQHVKALLWAIAAPAVALLLPLEAWAVPVQVDALFDGGLGADTFTITAQGGAGVSTIRFDLTTADDDDVFFQPSDDPFVVLDPGGTGFDGMFNATKRTLELNFSSFDPGETFVFEVEVEDARNFEGSIIEVTFDALAPNVASAMFERDGLFDATATVIADVNVNNGNVPEPVGASLLLLGLAGLWTHQRRTP